MEKEINLKQLANAVQWWMSYVSAVGRSYVLAESSIKYPLAEYLERSNLNKIELEFGHPKLSKKRFDLHYEDAKNCKTAIEFKFIKNGSTRDTNEKKRVFNDLMRLHLYLEDDKKGYFLICGAQSDFFKDFFRLLTKPAKSTKDNPYITEDKSVKKVINLRSKGFYSQWFSFDIKNPEKHINLQIKSGQYKKIYDSFIEDYKDSYIKTTPTDPDLKLPASITTKLVYLSKEKKHEDKYYQPATVGIWEIIKQTTSS